MDAQKRTAAEIHRELQSLEALESSLARRIADSLAAGESQSTSQLVDEWLRLQARQVDLLDILGEALRLGLEPEAKPAAPARSAQATTGRIVRLIRERGFGFIRSERGQEVFFHRSALPGSSFDLLHGNEPVEFELGVDPRSGRERAVNVRVAE